MHILYLDESGDHGLGKINKEFPVFVLSGCIFAETFISGEYMEQANALKAKYFSSSNIILHSRDIRKWEGPFRILANPVLRSDFYKHLNSLISSGKFTIITAVINKKRHIKEYGPAAHDPYELSLSFIMERFVFFLDDINGLEARIVAESRGRKEDQQLNEVYQKIITRGTYYVDRKRFQAKIRSLSFAQKQDNVLGVQIADLVAYPIGQKVLFPERENLAYDVFEDKFYRRFPDNDYLGYGLKIFP